MAGKYLYVGGMIDALKDQILADLQAIREDLSQQITIANSQTNIMQAQQASMDVISAAATEDLVEKTIIFRKSVPPASSGTIEKAVSQACQLVGVNVAFFAGENGTLRLTPKIKIGAATSDLFEYADASYLSGDDNVYSLKCKYSLAADDKLIVAYSNTGAAGSPSSQVVVDFIVKVV